METQLQEPKNGDHKLIWQELIHIKDIIDNHIQTRLDRLDKRFWWIIGTILVTGIITRLL